MIFAAPASHCRLLLVVAALLGLVACASGPKLYTNQNPSARFSEYQTYGFAQPLGTDKSEYSSLLSQYLTNAVSRELDARGYVRSDQPDLQINFFVNTKEKIRTTQTPAAGGYYSYRRGYYDPWGGYETRVDQFTEGTLTVDLVDTQANQLVWEANLVGRVREEARENLEAAIDQAISNVFAEYPYRGAE